MHPYLRKTWQNSQKYSLGIIKWKNFTKISLYDWNTTDENDSMLS